MKRSPITRKTRLSPGVKQLRRAALNRSSSLSRQAATRAPLVSRPKPVTPEERRARAVVKTRSQGRCEMCARATGQEMHHRKNRSQGGLWAPENLLHLCTPHHLDVTVNVTTAVERGWSVRSTQDPADQPVWLAGRGWSYLTADGGIVPAETEAA